MPFDRTNREHPCPICGRPDGCGVSKDGAVVLCSREPSDTLVGEPFAGGWVHTIDKSIGRKFRKAFTFKKPRRSPAEWHKMMLEYRKLMRHTDWQLITQALGLKHITLARYFVGKYPNKIPTFTHPMWNGYGQLCGIRICATDGSKWSVKDSRNGLYIPTILTGQSPLLICEGRSDPMAATEMGFDAIGRFNCMGGLTDIRVFLKRNHYEQVVIVSDADDPKKRRDGSFWYPGAEGAWKLCKQLTGSKIIKPPFKDLRKWYNEGATRQDVLGLING